MKTTKKCKICGEDYVLYSSLTKCPKCVKNIPKNRATMPLKPKKVKKTISKSSAKNRAWKAFSLYIRNLEMDNLDGFGYCVTCNKLLTVKTAQAGHFIGGRLNSILFIEDNVHIQCVGCNVFLRGNYDKYLIYMLDRYGEQRVRELAQMKQESLKYSIQDYLDIEERYREKLRNLGHDKIVIT